MFSKTADSEGAPATRTGGASSGRSHLSSDLKIKGNLTSSGTIEVLGEIEGDIDAKALVIGAEGQVSGKIRAETIEVRGNLSGSASCVTFTLRSTAVATVQVTYETLVIENGAEIEGKFKHAPSKA